MQDMSCADGPIGKLILTTDKIFLPRESVLLHSLRLQPLTRGRCFVVGRVDHSIMHGGIPETSSPYRFSMDLKQGSVEAG